MVACRALRFGKLDRIFQVPRALVPKTSRQLAMAVRLAALPNRLGLYCSVGMGSRCTGSVEESGCIGQARKGRKAGQTGEGYAKD